MNGLCEEFQKLSAKGWDMLAKGHHILSEPTITELLLLDLLELEDKYSIHTRKFNSYEEGTITGADWELWLIHDKGGICIRFQAKKLDSITLRYEELDYSNIKSKFQVDRLIEDAKRKNAIPLYLFYNYWSGKIHIPWKCRSFSEDKKLLGYAIADAHKIKKFIESKIKNLSNILTVSYPWHCLVCCEGYVDSTSIDKLILPKKSLHFIVKALMRRDIKSSNQEFYQKIPDYVQMMLHHDINDKNAEIYKEKVNARYVTVVEDKKK